MLGVDSVTDDSSDVVSLSSISSERIGEGPGKWQVATEVGETGNSEDKTERLATDSGSGTLAILVIYRDSVTVALQGS